MGELAAFCSSITWATGSSVYSILSKRYPPHIINFNRALIGIAGCLLFALIEFGSFGQVMHALATAPMASVGWLTASTFGSFAVGDAFFILSMRSLGPSSALAICSSYPIWSALAGWILHGESLSYTRIFGLLLTVAGVITVILAATKLAPRSAVVGTAAAGLVPEAKPHSVAFFDRKEAGIAFALLTSFAWTLNVYSIHRAGDAVSSHILNLIRMILAALIVPVVGVAATRKLRFSMSRKDVRRYGWAFVVESVLGAFFFLYGLTHTQIAIGAVLSSLAPVISVPIAVAMGWEKFQPVKVAGVLAVVAGVALLVGG